MLVLTFIHITNLNDYLEKQIRYDFENKWAASINGREFINI